MLQTSIEIIREEIKKAAAKQVAKYPQYKGHFDNYVLVKLNKTIKGKCGVSFQKDELAIAVPQINWFYDIKNKKRECITVWSNIHGWDVSVPAKAVISLEGTFKKGHRE